MLRILLFLSVLVSNFATAMQPSFDKKLTQYTELFLQMRGIGHNAFTKAGTYGSQETRFIYADRYASQQNKNFSLHSPIVTSFTCVQNCYEQSVLLYGWYLNHSTEGFADYVKSSAVQAALNPIVPFSVLSPAQY